MLSVLTSPVAAVFLSLLAYALGTWLRRRTGWAVLNPLAVATVLVIALLAATPLEVEAYLEGTAAISLFLVPVTTVLALKIHHQWPLLRANLLPILLGCTAGSAASMGSVWALCRLFGLDAALTASLLPKSVTSPIAIELSQMTGGMGSLTVSVVVFTGIIAAMLAPLLIRVFKLKNPLALGLALGASGHAMGTAKAIELGEIEGAVSGIALTLSGIITSLIYVMIF